MNEFGNKCLDLWEKHKTNREGLKITAPRQAGKTTFLLQAAQLEELQGNKVVIFSRNTRESRSLKSQYIIMHGEPVLIYFESVSCMTEPSNCNYRFYDECPNPRDDNNVLAVSSLHGNEMIFGIDWAVGSSKCLKRIKAEMGKERFNMEFNSGIVTKRPFSWKDRYKND